MTKLLWLLRSDAFRHDPLRLVWRTFQAAVLTAIRKTKTYTFDFGDQRIRFRFSPLGRGCGSLGIFLLRERYEPLLEFGDALLEPGMTVIDGGANQGIFTCAFARRVGPSGRVYAFEPLEYAVALLRDNVALNDLENVTIVQAGIFDRAGEMPIDLSEGATSASIARDLGGESILRVPVTDLDTFLAERNEGRVDFLKLDVEGAELEAIRGAMKMIDRDKPCICVESQSDGPYDEILSLLPGYDAYAFTSDGRLESVSEWRYAANLLLAPAGWNAVPGLFDTPRRRS